MAIIYGIYSHQFVMPRKRKTTKKLRKDVIFLGNISVNDYANSNSSRGMSKQSSINSYINKVQRYIEHDINWDQINTHSHSQLYSKETTECKYCQNSNSCNENVFPIDLWFLISDHIGPEDVGRFASICTATQKVVSTAGFWYSLYRRFHKWSPELPEDLHSWNINDEVGLRGKVIRSLFYMFPPFVSRLQNHRALEDDTSVLNSAQCSLQWQQKCPPYFNYYFKLCQIENSKCLKKGNPLVHYNPEEFCYILVVRSTSMCRIPMVVGLFLSQCCVGVSSNLQHNTIKLSFAAKHMLSSVKNNKAKTFSHHQVFFEPVVEMKVLPWWHPNYNTCSQVSDCKV